MSRLSINCQSDLVIDNQFVKDLVPDEYKKFHKIYETTELDHLLPVNYSNVSSYKGSSFSKSSFAFAIL